MFVFSFDELQILYLNKTYYDSHDHHGIDKSVIDIDDDTGNELVVGLVDEREVEDEGDGECDQREETQEETNLRVGPVQWVMSCRGDYCGADNKEIQNANLSPQHHSLPTRQIWVLLQHFSTC